MLSKHLRETGISLHKVMLYIALGACVLTTLSLVIVRYLPGVALYGIPEAVTLCAAWLYFAGMGYVSYQKKHITVDLLTWRFAESGSFSRYSGLVSSFITIAVCLAYGYLGFQYCLNIASMGQRTIDIGYPRIILVSSIALGFTLMTLYTVFHLVTEIRAFKDPERRRTS